MNVAIITHNKYDRYLFEVPAGISLNKGDTVLVRSRKGESTGTLVYDSFEIDGAALEALVAASQWLGDTGDAEAWKKFRDAVCAERVKRGFEPYRGWWEIETAKG